MASERLLILQPHNWALRRDHGMMLYFNRYMPLILFSAEHEVVVDIARNFSFFREYGEAVQELSICMAFAPEEEAAVLEPFVEKLHLLRLESSWKSFSLV